MSKTIFLMLILIFLCQGNNTMKNLSTEPSETTLEAIRILQIVPSPNSIRVVVEGCQPTDPTCCDPLTDPTCM
jgi:hypothetical protein